MAIENNIARCAANLIMLAQQYLTGEQTVRIVGTESAPVWLTFDKDYISGQFDFTVEAGSTAPRNEAFRRDMALQMVSAMQPFAQAGLVNLEKLAEYVLSIGFGVKNPGNFLQSAPQAPPMPNDQMPPEMQGMPPEGMEGMPPEGELPPELLAMLQGGQPQVPAGMIPGAPMQGPGPQTQGSPAGILDSLPPEVLQALLAQMQGQQAPM